MIAVRQIAQQVERRDLQPHRRRFDSYSAAFVTLERVDNANRFQVSDYAEFNPR